MEEYDDDYDNGYEDWYYDDGYWGDDDEEEYDDYDIPTYDELSLEGRYYTYGSRENYNEWRREQIQAIREEENRRREMPASTGENRHYQEQGGCLSVVVILVFSAIAFLATIG